MTTTTFDQAFADGIEGLAAWLRTKENLLTEEQANKLGALINRSSDTEIMFLWVAAQRNIRNLIALHSIVEVEHAVIRASNAMTHARTEEQLEAQRRAAMVMTGHL